MGGRHKYNGVLPGAPRDRSQHRLSTTPVPHSPWHDASHLGLGGLVLLRINPHESPGPKVHIWEEGVSQVISGSAMLVSHAVVTRVNCTKESPQGVSDHSAFPPLHMGFLNHFRVLRPKAQVARATLIRLLSRICPEQTLVVPESHNAASWEAPVVKYAISLYGNLTAGPG
jgi:hypothetical protein